MMANADNSVVTPHTAGSGGVWMTAAMLGYDCATWVRSAMPPFRPQMTNAPTARNATSLTIDSTAIANETEVEGAPGVSVPLSREATTVRSVVETALSCSAT